MFFQVPLQKNFSRILSEFSEKNSIDKSAQLLLKLLSKITGKQSSNYFIPLFILTLFIPFYAYFICISYPFLVSFYIPWKYLQTRGFLMFPGVMERDQQHETDQTKKVVRTEAVFHRCFTEILLWKILVNWQ